MRSFGPRPRRSRPRAAGKQSPFQVFRWGRLAGAACAVAADLFGALFERPAPPQLPRPAGAGGGGRGIVQNHMLYIDHHILEYDEKSPI